MAILSFELVESFDITYFIATNQYWQKAKVFLEYHNI